MCRHRDIVDSMRAMIETTPLDELTDEYLTRSTMATFFQFFSINVIAGPSEAINRLNRCVQYSPLKLQLIESPELDLMAYTSACLGLPVSTLTKWFTPASLKLTPSTKYALVGAVETTLMHLTPLRRVVRASPGDFREVMAVYNRLWKVDRISEHLCECCPSGQTLYNLAMTAIHPPDNGDCKLTAVISQLRSHLGLPPRVMTPGPVSIDFTATFNKFLA